MKKRKVYSGEAHHVFQRTRNKGVIFYSIHDYLVYFTIYCSQARQRGVSVLSLCPMPDHTHQVIVAASKNQMATFVQTYSHLFAYEWNKKRKKKGFLFSHPFGSAAKLGNKQVRTVLAYSNNNPVERKLVERAEDYRWTFLAYYNNRNPFSLPLNESHAKSYMRMALKEIKQCHDDGQYITYSMLERWESHLSATEWQQIADYIIGLWNVIDYEQAISYYGSYDTMLRAFHDNTGSEYEIREDHDNYTDTVYADCTHVLQAKGLSARQLSAIPSLPMEQKQQLYYYLLSRTSARPVQVKKYLHLALDLTL